VEHLGNGGLQAAGEVEAFSNLRTGHVVLVGRDGDRGEDADDRDDDHEFDEGETLLDGTLHGYLL